MGARSKHSYLGLFKFVEEKWYFDSTIDNSIHLLQLPNFFEISQPLLLSKIIFLQMQSIILVTSIAKPAWQNRHPMQRVPIGARSTHPYLDLFEFKDKWYFFYNC